MCISGLGTRWIHPIRAAENGCKRSKRNPYIRILSLKTPVYTEPLVIILALYGYVLNTELICLVTKQHDLGWNYEKETSATL